MAGIYFTACPNFERMHRKFFMLCFVCLHFLSGNAQLPPIGQWREHFSWSNCVQFAESDQKLWCATEQSFFSIDAKDQSLSTYGKLDGLSSIGIQKIAWDPTSQTLVAVYNNGSIDLLKNGTIKSIADFKLSAQPDKHINNLTCNNGFAYLSTQWGILVLDLTKKIIKDSYIIGENGNRIAVFCVGFFANRMYALSSEGLKSASFNSTNLADFRNWSKESLHLLPDAVGNDLTEFNGNLLTTASDSIFIFQNNGWKLFYADGKEILEIKNTGTQLLIIQKNGNVNRCNLLDTNGKSLQIIENSNLFPQLSQCTVWSGNLWIADKSKGLYKYFNNQYLPLSPNGPNGRLFGPLVSIQNTIWGVSGLIVNTESNHGIFRFKDEEWSSFKPAGLLTNTFFPITSIVCEASGKSIWVGTAGDGLLNFDEQQKATYLKQGSGLEASGRCG